jgi:hypothetical protein
MSKKKTFFFMEVEGKLQRVAFDKSFEKLIDDRINEQEQKGEI